MKVVIVDDEWYGLDLTYRLLTQIRMDLEVVAFFQDANEALEKIPMLNPQLIILDVEMPHINGFEMYDRLKELRCHFMMVSAHSSTYLRSKLCSNNVSILTKPFCKADMSAILYAMEI